jgi:hypothetical protein
MASRAAGAVLALLLMASCRQIGLIKEYEYDERVSLSLDGSAIVDVSASLAALAALRGVKVDLDPEARFDRQAIRRLYEGPGAIVREVSAFRRHGRRFVHVRLETGDITQLGRVAPLSWSRYTFDRRGNEYRFVQEVGAREPMDVDDVGWTGREVVAFRVHLPSRINFHDSGNDVERGNVLVWQQTLRDRLAGAPLRMEARMDTQSILYRTLWLFGGTFLAAAALLMIVVWWVARKGRSVVPA